MLRCLQHAKAAQPGRPGWRQKASARNICYSVTVMIFQPPISARISSEKPPISARNTPFQEKNIGRHWTTLDDIGRLLSTLVPLLRQNGRISLPGDNGAGRPPCQLRQHPVYGPNGRTNQDSSERLRTSNRSVSQGELQGKWKRPDWDQELSHSTPADETTEFPVCNSCQKSG